MKISTKYLYPGMELNEEIKTYEGDLFSKGTLISKNIINTIIKNDYSEIDILISNSNETFNGNFKEYIKNAIKDNNIELLKYISTLFERIYHNISFNIDLSKYTSKEYDLYDHIVNMTIFATRVATLYNVNAPKDKQIDISELALSCMLSKYGKRCKNEEYFKKTREHMNFWDKEKFPNIKAEDFYKYNDRVNTLYAYILLDEFDIDENVRENILLSNEYYNNPSSPLGAKLLDYGFSSYVASLISVADTYDMLLIEGAIKDKNEPFKEVVSKINKYVSIGYLNPFWTKFILYDIPLYKEGDKVILTDSTIAYVKSYDPKDPLRPKITDKSGNIIEYKDDLRVLRLVDTSY